MKRKIKGYLLIGIGVLLFSMVILIDENIWNKIPDIIAFIYTMFSLCLFFVGVFTLLGRQVEEILEEESEKKIEDKELEKYFNKKPYITYVLLGINVIVFVILNLIINNEEVLLEFSISKSSLLNGEFYKLITYMFIHGNEIHLLFNMLFLLMFGSKLENLLGRIKYIILYILSGIIGGLFICLFDGASTVGASAALYGILTSLLFIAFINKDIMKIFLTKTLLPILIYGLIESVLFTGVSFYGHLGGSLFGILFIFFTGKNKYKLQFMEQRYL